MHIRARRALIILLAFQSHRFYGESYQVSRSAGRVQSVALRLICEREAEIETFISEEYWSIETVLGLVAGEQFKARLTHLDGTKLGKLDIKTETEAYSAVTAISLMPVSPFNQSRQSACAVTLSHPSQHQPCSKSRHVSLDFLQAEQCKLPKNFMKALISAVKPRA